MRMHHVGLALILTLAAAALGQEPPRPPDPPPEIDPGRSFERLDLTAGQRDAIEELRIETRRQVIPLDAGIELKQIDLKDELRKDVPDRSRVLKIAKEIHDLRWEIKEKELNLKMKIRGLLTAEQRAKMKFHGPEMRKRHKDRCD